MVKQLSFFNFDNLSFDCHKDGGSRTIKTLCSLNNSQLINIPEELKKKL